jgi:allophanate hydrolase
MGPAGQAALRSLQAIAASDRHEVWISVVPAADLLAAADAIDRAVADGADLPLAGLTFAVKDNIDVGGWATTAGCPAFAYQAETDAPAVRALTDAGALYVGKTNLDQFATGLVGTRSPYGAVRNALDPERISGGSSSGSAVAVALGLVDLALGTDTAGSGRVPAALNGIVGMKATYGLVSTDGVVPACRSFDCVTVFARDVTTAERAMAELTGPRGAAPGRRSFPLDAPLGAPPAPVIARVAPGALGELAPGWLAAYDAAVDTLAAAGCRVVEIDLEPFLEAGRLLYGGAFVAERYAAVGAWIAEHPDQVDPTVGSIILGAADLAATRLADDMERLARLRVVAQAHWDESGADTLVLPTTTWHPTLDQVAADPIGANTRLGRFTTFCNLLDLCAVAVPADMVDGLPFGVSCLGPAFSDLVQADVARLLAGSSSPAEGSSGWREARVGRMAPPGIALAVVGAHLRGQPLNHQLTDRGARCLGTAVTALTYRLHALDTVPPKPGLVRALDGGAPIELEIWELSPAAFGDFVAQVPSPMVIGTVDLSDGTQVSGFSCEPAALEGAADITEHGGWRAYLAWRPTA